MDKTVYAANARPYTYTFRPASELSDRRYLDDQLLDLSHSTQSLADAVSELQRGTSSGASIRLAPTGVEPGTYERATISVSEDGRLVGVSTGPEPVSPIPLPPRAGLVLTSTTRGSLVWVEPSAGLPGGASPGQVLVQGTSGPVWASPQVAEVGVRRVEVQSDADLDVTDGVVSGEGVIGLELRPTGVIAGRYERAIVTVDAKGRITHILEGEPGLGGEIDGTYSWWRVCFPAGPSAATPVVGTVAFRLTRDGDDLAGTETRPEDGSIVRHFEAEYAVSAVSLTVADASRAPRTVSVQGSLDGAFWFEVWSIGAANWIDGETRTLTRMATTTLTGDVTGTGEGEVTTSLAPTGVIEGTYTAADITVDAKGRITRAANGAAPPATGGGSFDLDRSIPYLTFTTPDGTEVQASVSNEPYAWVFEDVTGISLEDGSTLESEDGTASIAPEA